MPEQDPPKKKDHPKPTGYPVPQPEKQGAPIEQDPPKKKGDK